MKTSYDSMKILALHSSATLNAFLFFQLVFSLWGKNMAVHWIQKGYSVKQKKDPMYINSTFSRNLRQSVEISYL